MSRVDKENETEVNNAEQLSDNIDLLTRIDDGSNAVYTLTSTVHVTTEGFEHDVDGSSNKREYEDSIIHSDDGASKRLRVCLADDEKIHGDYGKEQEQPVIDDSSNIHAKQSITIPNEGLESRVTYTSASLNDGMASSDQRQVTATVSSSSASANEEKWQRRFSELKTYKEVNGNCLVPRSYPDNPPLGKWVKMQRFQYKLFTENKASRLTTARIQQLNDIGFKWIVRSRKVTWETRYDELIEFKRLKGNCLVPMRYADNPQLGRWVEVQRKEYKKWQKNERSGLTAEHIQKLEEIGFVWSVTCEWDVRFKELTEYQQATGNCMVPRNYPQNQPLAYWVGHQRKEMSNIRQNKTSRLTEQRISALESIGFCWDASSGVTWESRWDELYKFKEMYGHCQVRSENNPELAKWCRQMRKEYGNFQKGKRSRLSAEKVIEMENIGFVWNIKGGDKSGDDAALYTYHEGSVGDDNHVVVNNELAIGTAAALAIGASNSNIDNINGVSDHDNVTHGGLVPLDVSMRVIDEVTNDEQPALESSDIHCSVNSTSFLASTNSIDPDVAHSEQHAGETSIITEEFEV